MKPLRIVVIVLGSMPPAGMTQWCLLSEWVPFISFLPEAKWFSEEQHTNKAFFFTTMDSCTTMESCPLGTGITVLFLKEHLCFNPQTILQLTVFLEINIRGCKVLGMAVL